MSRHFKSDAVVRFHTLHSVYVLLFLLSPASYIINELKLCKVYDFWLPEQTQHLNTCTLFSCTTCFGRVYRPSSGRNYSTTKWKVYWGGGHPFTVKTLKVYKLSVIPYATILLESTSQMCFPQATENTGVVIELVRFGRYDVLSSGIIAAVWNVNGLPPYTPRCT